MSHFPSFQSQLQHHSLAFPHSHSFPLQVRVHQLSDERFAAGQHLSLPAPGGERLRRLQLEHRERLARLRAAHAAAGPHGAVAARARGAAAAVLDRAGGCGRRVGTWVWGVLEDGGDEHGASCWMRELEL